jgi:hypothetical protein
MFHNFLKIDTRVFEFSSNVRFKFKSLGKTVL